MSNETESVKKNDFNEMKKMIWLTVISVWVVLAMLLITGTRATQNNKRNQKLVDQIEGLKTDMLTGSEKLGISVDQMLKDRDQVIKKEIKAASAGLQKNMRALQVDEIRQVNTAIRNAFNAETKTIAQSLNGVMAKMKDGQNKLAANVTQAFDKNMKSQAGLVTKAIEGIRKEQKQILVQINGLHNSERMKVLRKFVENQTLMLKELSGALNSDPNSVTGAKEVKKEK